MQGARAHQDCDLAAFVQHVRGALQIFVRRHDFRPRVSDARMRRAVLVRRRLVFEVLQVVRQDKRGYAPFGQRDAHGAIDHMPHLRRHARLLHVGARHILEHRREIDFLLIMRAERRARLLPDYREHRHVIHSRVIESRNQMRGTRAGCGNAHAQFAGKFGVRARHERRHFLMTCLHEFDFSFRTIEGTEYAIDAVTWITVHAPDAPLMKPLDDKVAHCLCHESLLPKKSRAMSLVAHRAICLDSKRCTAPSRNRAVRHNHC